MRVDGCLEEIYKLCDEEEFDKALDVLMDLILDLDSKTLDEVLVKFNLNRIDEGSIIHGILIVASKCLNELKYHNNFCDKVITRMVELGRDKEITKKYINHYRRKLNYA